MNILRSIPFLAVFLLVACQGAFPLASTATPSPTVDIHCTGSDPNPIGQEIAETYAISYEQVMTWFCEGYSFDNILIALETSKATEIPTETLLEMALEKDWETIWQEIGFTGTP